MDFERRALITAIFQILISVFPMWSPIFSSLLIFMLTRPLSNPSFSLRFFSAHLGWRVSRARVAAIQFWPACVGISPESKIIRSKDSLVAFLLIFSLQNATGFSLPLNAAFIRIDQRWKSTSLKPLNLEIFNANFSPTIPVMLESLMYRNIVSVRMDFLSSTTR